MKISIVLVNYNTEKLLINCLDSVYQYEINVTLEIIIVNNGGTLQNLEKHFLDKNNIQIIDSGGNIGFSKANNLGTKSATGEYLLFLNSDTLFIQPILGQMTHELDEDPKIGMLGCQLLNPDLSLQKSYHDGDNVFEKLWRRNPIAIKFFGASSKINSSKNRIDQKHQNKHDAPWLSGACLMLRKKNIENYKWYWEEDFFMYWEDVELSYRIRKKGFVVCYSPTEKIIHLGGGGEEENISLSRFNIMEEAKLIFIEKSKGKLTCFIYQFLMKWELRLERFLNRNQLIQNPILQKEIDFYLKKEKS